MMSRMVFLKFLADAWDIEDAVLNAGVAISDAEHGTVWRVAFGGSNGFDCLRVRSREPRRLRGCCAAGFSFGVAK
jgi:hypothetical protein